MSKAAPSLYFAYGSNLYQPQMEERCPNSKPFMKAILHNYALVFPFKAGERWDHGGVAGIAPQSGLVVEGFLYHMGDGDFDKLDYFEGISEGYYSRSFIEVDTAQGIKEVQTYICNGKGDYTPSLKYMEALFKGSIQCSLSKEYQNKLEKLRNSSVSKG